MVKCLEMEDKELAIHPNRCRKTTNNHKYNNSKQCLNTNKLTNKLKRNKTLVLFKSNFYSNACNQTLLLYHIANLLWTR